MQDDVTEKIIAALRVKVEKAEIERVLRKPSASLEAYDYALRGKAYHNAMTKEQNARAQEMYRVGDRAGSPVCGGLCGLGLGLFQRLGHNFKS